MITILNIGQTHPSFMMHRDPKFTQVLVLEEGFIIAHFFGPFAKRNAGLFVMGLSNANT